MTMKLYSEESVQAIADAIRAKTGGTAAMTVGQMSTEITTLLGREAREVWLHGPRQKSEQMRIDTGVAGNLNHTIEVICYGNLYASTVPFGAVTSTSSRQVFDLMTTSNKIRVAWGNSGIKENQYTTDNWSAWHPMTVTLNRFGMTLVGYNQSFVQKTLTYDFDPTVSAGASTANYAIFCSVSAAGAGGGTGAFRSAKIYNDEHKTTLLHHFVPIMYNDYTLALLDKVTGTEQVLPSGETGFEAYWTPYTDTLIGINS